MARIVIVVALSLLFVALWAPEVPRFFGHPLAFPGFSVGRDGIVESVAADSGAERAGIRAGDRVDFAQTPLHSRILLVGSNYEMLHPPQRFPVRIAGPHGSFTALVQSMTEGRADEMTVLPRVLFSLILLAAGITLVMLRPSKATWGFFVFVLFGPIIPANRIAWFGPEAYQAVMVFMLGPAGFFAISLVGGIIFALYLLVQSPPSPWRRRAEVATYAVAGAITIATAWSTASAMLLGKPIVAVEAVSLAFQVVAACIAPMLLLTTYHSADPATRERLRWVLFAFTVNAAVDLLWIASAQTFVPIATPYWLWATAAGIDAFILAFAILYAVLKHHVVDINVAISRAVVYALLSAIVVSAFALVDLFFTKALSESKAGFIADLALALVLGFFFNSLHQRVDRFVDRVLFRKRHAAEEHLRTVVKALPFSVSPEQVDHLITHEPVRSFALSGATLLKGSDSHAFRLCRSFGAARCGSGRPRVLARRLNRYRIYGLHENGTDFDAEEVSLFEALAASAGAAYDRLEAKRLREELHDRRVAAAVSPAQT